MTHSFEIWTFAGHDIACILYICTVSTTIYAYVLCFFFSNKKIVLYCALYIIHYTFIQYNFTIIQGLKIPEF